MTAGIGAANVLAVPPDKVEPAQSTVRDVGLAAYIKIPIIDIGPTPGPLSITRKLAIEAGTNPLLLGILQEGGNTYNLPGLNTLFDSTSHPRVVATQGPDSVDFAFLSDRTQDGGWSLLGGALAAGSSQVTDHRDAHFEPFFGGSRGTGFGINGVLGETTYDRNFSLLNSNLDIAGDRTLAEFDGVTAVKPSFDGFKAVGGGTLVDATPVTTFNLGSLTGGVGGHGGINGDGGLCLGSSQGDTDCGGRISFVRIAAPVSGRLTLGNAEIASADFEDNEVSVELRPGQFSVTGAVGGTFTIGGLEIGRPIPINIQIPGSSSLTTLNSTSLQSETVKASFIAVPGKSGSDNGTASTGRHAARDAVNSAISEVRTAVKTAVSNVPQSKPRHAKPDTDED